MKVGKAFSFQDDLEDRPLRSYAKKHTNQDTPMRGLPGEVRAVKATRADRANLCENQRPVNVRGVDFRPPNLGEKRPRLLF